MGARAKKWEDAIATATTCLFVPLLYFASFGPALIGLKRLEHSGLSSSIVEGAIFVFYFPLIWLHDSHASDSARAFLDWYVALWGVR